jgi:hypothetical protein
MMQGIGGGWWEREVGTRCGDGDGDKTTGARSDGERAMTAAITGDGRNCTCCARPQSPDVTVPLPLSYLHDGDGDGARGLPRGSGVGHEELLRVDGVAQRDAAELEADADVDAAAGAQAHGAHAEVRDRDACELPRGRDQKEDDDDAGSKQGRRRVKGRGLTLLPRRHRRRATCRSRRRVDADHGGCRSFSESQPGEAVMREGDRGSSVSAHGGKGKGIGGLVSAHGEDRKGEGITEGMPVSKFNRAADARRDGRNQNRTKKMSLF